MAVGRQQSSHLDPDIPQKVYKYEGTVEKEAVEPGMPKNLKNLLPWSEVIEKGTAKEEKQSPSLYISIIAQPECENNHEICPSFQQHQIYNTDSKQYSHLDTEHTANNVVNSTEGKPAHQSKTPRIKGKKAKRKRRQKNGSQNPDQRISKQECRAPIPVQDEESQHNLNVWWSDGKEKKEKHNTISNEHQWQELYLLKEDGLKEHHKPINIKQCIYHIGGGKLPPSAALQDPSLDSISEILKTLGTKRSCDVDYGEITSPKYGSPKLKRPYEDSKTDSVEECMLAALRGSVSMGEPKSLCTFAEAWKQEADDEDRETDTEGVILTEKLKTEDYEYKEDIHWTKDGEALGSGSFGDVLPAKDEQTGVRFAVKKIHQSRFRSQELKSCLWVSSPKLVPVYGAVREGPWINVFLKLMTGGSLGQLIKLNGYLPEDRALYYLGQVLEGLTHLHAKSIVHGDIKADNILLSEDGNDAYLCDLGHSAYLPMDGSKKQLLTSDYVPGTETHMAPEIVRGDACDTKLDVWSSCCMMLHLLNGWHPWSRTHKPPLCLKIATEPPPVKEIPPTCDPQTCEVIVAGLEKDPFRRVTAAQLQEKVNLALHKIGGLKSPWKSEYKMPRNFPDTTLSPSPVIATETPIPKHEPALHDTRPNPNKSKPERIKQKTDSSAVQLDIFHGKEIQMEREYFLTNLFLESSLEEQEQMLSCLSEENMDLHRSHKDSVHTFDTASSGIYSWDSKMDPLSLKSDSLINAGVPTTPSCFNGYKVQLQTLSGEKLHILESGGTKLGDLAVGISSQIPLQSFTILTPEGKPVPWSTDIAECGIHLQCALAPDHGGGWIWRVMRGRLEQGPMGEVYRGGGSGGGSCKREEAFPSI
ncbi:mitogen-activated protein kinase kinase kinase 14 [Xenopus laevis]|uniref:Mitogen-activated protein kinase kinase kinase 14 n=1 Tax=Xenopus laevis TaxID=8355 RepID=A0A8J0TU38_XENLA|nr:mitogen-activated protein kinase kinase kinase 14 [Xenopus laevis]XP_041432186.1 mitogen-activated protein kinase kinase kinase 14 [Xenopus laevis]